MSKFQDRIDAAPTHVAYFTRGAGVLITQTMGEVVAEDGESVTIQSAAIPNGQAVGATVVIPRVDLLARKDNGERISQSEWDGIFATHGHQQRKA